MSYPWHQSFLPLFFCCSLFHLSSLCLLWWRRCLRPLLLFVPTLIHSTMSLGKYDDELAASVFPSVSFAAPHSLPLSLPDIKSTLIRLLLNLWWPRHLTVELHQWLKNTESKWRCNSSGVGPWPLIELKDMGNIVRECEKRDKYWMIGHLRWREVARRGRREISRCKSDFGNT